MSSDLLIRDPPVNRWNDNYISPGPVGSVGDALTSIQLKTSAPSMPRRWSQTYSPLNDQKRGSNVQDGQWNSFSDGGSGAVLKKQKFTRKADVGQVMRDIVPAARSTEPVLAVQKTIGYKAHVAEIVSRSGDLFPILPGGYSPESGVLLRGGQTPMTTIIGGSDVPTSLNRRKNVWV